MLSLFKDRAPLSLTQRVNLQLLMRRTLKCVGPQVARRAKVVTELAELQLDTSTPASLCDSAAAEIAARFPVTGRSVEITIVSQISDGLPANYRPNSETSGAQIQIHRETLFDPLRAVTVLAAQLANHYWCSSHSSSSDEIDPELFELLPLVCGLGVLAAEASFYDTQWSDRGWQGWSMSRSGYYNAAEIGFTLALLARCRHETRPAYLKAARLDTRATAHKALRYFRRCDQRDIPLLFDAQRIPDHRSRPAELATWLRGDNLQFALAAAYVLDRCEHPSPQIVSAAIEAAESGCTLLMPILIGLIARSGDSTRQVTQIVQRAIASNVPETSVAGLLAAESLGMNMASYKNQVKRLLANYVTESIQLIALVGRVGAEFASLQPTLCGHLAEAIRFSNHEAIEQLLTSLSQICTDPGRAIATEIREADLRNQAMELLECHTPSLPSP